MERDIDREWSKAPTPLVSQSALTPTLNPPPDGDVLSDEGDGLAGPARPRCAAHTVDVVLGVSGDVKVHHHIDVGDIQASVTHTEYTQYTATRLTLPCVYV